jgi:hypothetical protein
VCEEFQRQVSLFGKQFIYTAPLATNKLIWPRQDLTPCVHLSSKMDTQFYSRNISKHTIDQKVVVWCKWILDAQILTNHFIVKMMTKDQKYFRVRPVSNTWIMKSKMNDLADYNYFLTLTNFFNDKFPV